MLDTAVSRGITEIDTAHSYSDFAAHRHLAALDPRTLAHLSITTKIGFFPEGHDLTPARLAGATRQIADELGRAPDTLLLHNPERSAEQFTPACEEMIRLREAGLCAAWGISTWEPGPLLGRTAPAAPDVIMVRCGLTTSARILADAEQLLAQLHPSETRGMSPFGGSTTDPIWSKVDPARFLEPASRAEAPARVQSALAVAFAVPQVSAIAVGTGDVGHLDQLCDALSLRADQNTIATYRALLAQRSTLSQTEPAKVGEAADT